MAEPSSRRSSQASEIKSISSVSSGVKRKRGSEIKFYAVRVGHKPGIYHTWSDCLEQVKGFKNATFKSFSSLTDAEAFLRGTSTSTSSGPQKYYAVAQGHTPGVYNDWPSALEQIKGFTKPMHKAFSTRAEADAFVQNNAAKAPSAVATTENDEEQSVSIGGQMGSPRAKKQKSATATGETAEPAAPGWDPLPADAEDGFDVRITLDEKGKLRYKTQEETDATKFKAQVDPAADWLYIYTDGACRSNGQQGAVAGVGVYFGQNDPRNVSEPLPGVRQTNQRAELMALKRALDICPLNRNTTIFSDSNYAIKCVTEWCKTWKKNGWINSSRKPVENRDIIEDIIDMIDERSAANVMTKFSWLKGHADDPGNVAADQLAVKGAFEAKANGTGSGSATPREIAAEN